MKNRWISAGCCLALATGAIGVTASAAPKRIADSNLEINTKTNIVQPEVIGPQKISRDEVKAAIDSGRPIILVDALPEKYFALSHLAKSINVPYEKCDQLAATLLPDKKAEIIVYCMDSK
ncbi:MAG: hypothetical protein C5B53_11155 [Candidatus Melainabacteria bacterium]|nr:MAG: hypothetical protein C5B53_11155 [Candidatus Melainabacteria bacterium]